MVHPCLRCGACCAFFRVQFYWREAVPEALVVDLDATYRAMKGTEKKHHPVCVALRGDIGQKAGCSIYEARPSPCREFMASYEDGRRNPRCDQARLAHGLRPLCRSDYLNKD